MRSVLLLFLSGWFSSLTTVQFVDEFEPLLRANRDQYLGGPHTADRQRAALTYFEGMLWNYDGLKWSHLNGLVGGIAIVKSIVQHSTSDRRNCHRAVVHAWHTG